MWVYLLIVEYIYVYCTEYIEYMIEWMLQSTLLFCKPGGELIYNVRFWNQLQDSYLPRPRPRETSRSIYQYISST